MESFAVLLVAAVLFLGFLFLGTYAMDAQFNGTGDGFWGGLFGQPAKKAAPVRIDLTSFPQFFIGFTKEDKARTVSYDDFSLGSESSMRIKEILAQDISNGLFSNDELSLDVKLEQATVNEAAGATLAFEVVDTNNYGNLVISWNGKDYYSDKPPTGKISLKLPKESLKNGNKLGIKSTGPGARFWADSVYSLKNIKLDVLTVSKRTIFFETFPEEMPTWSSGMLNFRRSEYSSQDGIIKAYVNGKLVYNRFPNEADKIEIGPTDIRSGNNMVSLESVGGTFGLKNIFMNVFLWKNRTSGVTKSFVLDESDVALLGKNGYTGTIDITIGEILKAAPLEIRFSGNRTAKSIFVTELKDHVSATFGSDQVVPGNNTMTFATDGSMRIASVDVFIQGR